MSDKVHEQSKMIRAKQAAFYAKQIYDPNWTPQVAVIIPIVTPEYTSRSVRFIDLREYLKGLTKYGEK